MGKAESLKREIEMLPPSMLDEVERLVERLKKKAQPGGKPKTLLAELAACAIDDDLPADLAEQHDHYLYGVPKR
jgi:hypothetical protein